MYMKPVRIEPHLYKLIQKRASLERRSITAMTNIILEESLLSDSPKETADIPTTGPSYIPDSQEWDNTPMDELFKSGAIKRGI